MTFDWTDPIEKANRAYAETFAAGDLDAPPTRELAVVTCMDARLNPAEFLGVDLGEAHVIRNAGGRVSDDVMRSLILSSRTLGTRHIVVIHHTSCGLTGTDEGVRATLAEDGLPVPGGPLLTFQDPRSSVTADVARIRADAHLPADVEVAGYVYDVETGRLDAVS